MKKDWQMGIVCNLVMLVLACVFLFRDKTTLIISLGIKAANAVFMGGWVLFSLLLVAVNILWLSRFFKNRPKPSSTPSGSLVYSTPNRMEPDRIRQELTQYHAERPALQKQIATALAQMDSMDRKQAKIANVFRRNDINSLNEVVSTIDAVEEAMCRNLTKLINRIIIWDPIEYGRPEKAELYRGHLAYIHKILDLNEEMLSKCDVLLTETVCYIDENNAGADTSRLHLEVMTETIQSLRQIHTKEQ